MVNGTRRLWMGLALLGFGLWLSATPYMGVDHDARLYVLMALRHLTPGAYASDPWFAWGSQDDWSLYSPLLALVLAQFGVAKGAMLMAMLQGGLFVISVACFCRAWLRGSASVLAFLLMVSMPLLYSPQGMLSVSEGFVTARGAAVPLSLLALAALRHRPRFALVLHLVALVAHPIMALGPVAASALLVAGARRLLLMTLAGLAAAASLFALGMAGALPMMDATWREFVEPAELVFILPWLSSQAVSLIAVFAVLLLGYKKGSRPARLLYLSAALVGAGGLAVSALATEIPVLILLKAQVWRTYWFSLLVAVLAASDLLARHLVRRHAPMRRVLGVGLIALLWCSYFFSGSAALLFAVAWIGGHFFSEAFRHWILGAEIALKQRGRWLAVALGGQLLLALPLFVLSLELAATSVERSAEWMLPVEGLFRTGGYGVVAGLVFLVIRIASPRFVLPPFIILVGVFLAAGYWDVRSAIQRDQEQRYSVDGRLNPFPEWIRRGDVVYWHQNPERVWLELGTSGYASRAHCTGLVFSRSRTLQLSERMVLIAARGADEVEYRKAVASGTLRNYAFTLARPLAPDLTRVLAAYEARASATAFGLRQLCADPDLDWVVDPFNMPGHYVARYTDTLGGVRQTSYLYDCRRLRAQPAAPEIEPAGHAS